MSVIEKPDHTTGTTYAQQEAMVRFLASECGASIRYVKVGEHSIAVVTLASGRVHRFDLYGISGSLFVYEGTCDFCLSTDKPVAAFKAEDGMVSCQECYEGMKEAWHEPEVQPGLRCRLGWHDREIVDNGDPPEFFANGRRKLRKAWVVCTRCQKRLA